MPEVAILFECARLFGPGLADGGICLGDDLIMDKATLRAAFGMDPVPHLQQVLATVAASIAAMAQVVSNATKGCTAAGSLIASEARGTLPGNC